MDGTVRVWNIVTGECVHTLTGHTSLVGLLGLSPSYLVSAAADSTLRIWDPDSGELRHTLAAHTGAITCFQHDEFKVLSGSDGNLKMWNVRDGTVVRDLLTGITGVWQVVFEGRWCVAASNRNDTTVLDVWDFGNDSDEEWLGEPPSGIYDEDIFSDSDEDEVDGLGPKSKRKDREMKDLADEDEEQEQADVDAMDQDLVPSETESIQEPDFSNKLRASVRRQQADDLDISDAFDADTLEGVDASRWAPTATDDTSTNKTSRPIQFGRPKVGGAAGARRIHMQLDEGAPGPSSLAAMTSAVGTSSRHLPPVNDETPTRPRIRQHHAPRRR